MTHSTSDRSSTSTAAPQPLNPWRYLTGGIISLSFAVAFYWMTSAIAHTFASKPVASTNPIVINISITVRTLVVGMTALGTGIFGLVGLGLLAYTLQTLWQRLKQPS